MSEAYPHQWSPYMVNVHVGFESIEYKNAVFAALTRNADTDKSLNEAPGIYFS